MRESKHTPGPWRAIYIEEMSPEERRAIEEPTICWCGGYDIVVVKQDTRGYDFHGDDIDDARLIAAAPELLDALSDARRAIASLDEYALGGVAVERTDGSGADYQYPIRDELLAKIDAAIAKAEGRSDG